MQPRDRRHALTETARAGLLCTQGGTKAMKLDQRDRPLRFGEGRISGY